MCTYSMVIDHYFPKFPDWTPSDVPLVPGPPLVPMPATMPGTFTPFDPHAATREALDEMKRLIDEFKLALAAAKTVDTLTGQPDCEDPEKAKLVARVDELEKTVRRLLALEESPKKRAPRKPKKLLPKRASKRA